MSGQTVKIRSSEGGEFDCYLVVPQGRRADAGRRSCWPPPSMASIRTSAPSPTNLPRNGVIAAAPDLFWRIDARAVVP